MSGARVLGYAAASGLLVLAPGPDFVVVMRNGLGGGRRAAIAAALGVSTGFLLWSMAVATGLATVLAASATAYTTMRILGVGYLIFLGVLSLRSASRPQSRADLGTGSGNGPPKPFSRSYREGLLTNVLNPKVAVTFLALMPQFLPQHPPVAQLALLSVVTVVIATLWFLVVAAVVSALQQVFARPAAARALEGVTGVVLVAFGVRLATD